ncbi:unnamed protein product [Orchesella dallaii]|uniref:Uncharacterized protein n=1 Tax=Orchesella dallaii TaxID=48710 RepID=A0ABP1Q243_9HEXA
MKWRYLRGPMRSPAERTFDRNRAYKLYLKKKRLSMEDARKHNSFEAHGQTALRRTCSRSLQGCSERPKRAKEIKKPEYSFIRLVSDFIAAFLQWIIPSG